MKPETIEQIKQRLRAEMAECSGDCLACNWTGDGLMPCAMDDEGLNALAVEIAQGRVPEHKTPKP